MKFGYIRVSTEDQNIARQKSVLAPLCDELIVDRLSGKNMERPGLELVLLRLRSGDELLVKSIDRLARNTRDLLTIIDTLVERGVRVRFLDFQIEFDNSPASRFMLTMMGAVAELERGFMTIRQKEGIALARERGTFRGRQPDQALREKLLALFKRDIKPQEAAKIVGCSKSSAYIIRNEYVDAGELEELPPRGARQNRVPQRHFGS